MCQTVAGLRSFCPQLKSVDIDFTNASLMAFVAIDYAWPNTLAQLNIVFGISRGTFKTAEVSKYRIAITRFVLGARSLQTLSNALDNIL